MYVSRSFDTISLFFESVLFFIWKVILTFIWDYFTVPWPKPVVAQPCIVSVILVFPAKYFAIFCVRNQCSWKAVFLTSLKTEVLGIYDTSLLRFSLLQSPDVRNDCCLRMLYHISYWCFKFLAEMGLSLSFWNFYAILQTHILFYWPSGYLFWFKEDLRLMITFIIKIIDAYTMGTKSVRDDEYYSNCLVASFLEETLIKNFFRKDKFFRKSESSQKGFFAK